jgi:hypothetical protein
MTVTALRTLTKDDLEVRALSGSEWRVSDRRVSPHDAFSLLGFIEKKHDVYEVMQLGRGFEFFSFPTFDEAIAHFHQVDRSYENSSDYVLSWLPSLT